MEVPPPRERKAWELAASDLAYKNGYWNLKGVTEWHVENEDEGFGSVLRGAKHVVFYAVVKTPSTLAASKKW